MRTFFASISVTVLILCTVGQAGADLHDPAQAADYLIIAPADLLQSYPWIQQLAAWRSQHGRTAMIVAADSIWTEFGNGLPSDTTLKDFLFYVYDHWSAPHLRDVFIIGWHDLVPSHIDSTGGAAALTDYYYAVRENSPMLPLFSVGRLPWSPSQTPQLYDYYSKVVAYESQPEAPWQTRLQLIADFRDQAFNFEDASEGTIVNLNSSITVTRDYCDHPQGDPWHGDSSGIMQHLNDGSLIVAPFSRADFGTWGSGLHLTPQNLRTLSNGARLPIVLGIELDVNVNDFAVSGIPRALLENPDGGAIAYFGMSNFCFVMTTVMYRQSFFQVAAADTPRVLGDVWRYAAAISPSPDIHAMWEMLLGDPGLRLPAIHADTKDFAPQPSSLSLSCYPNPFNPSTQIQFELNRTEHVKLEVMNVLGQHVATLVDAPQIAGSHTVTWSGADHPSGLYFAVLEAGSVRHVTKMMLLK
ncbi:MAG TPA: C25 family cysteine peptidase [bacterium]|jgi:hypothetical protein